MEARNDRRTFGSHQSVQSSAMRRKRLRMKLRVPFDPEYVILLGKAVYLFAYYEWIVIYIIEVLAPGFVATYSRGKPLPSGTVGKKFRRAIVNSRGLPPDDLKALDACATEFENLVDRRNALVHAHPITDTDGSQILHYQTCPSRPYPDMRWDEASIRDFLLVADAAVGQAHCVYMKLK